MEKRTGIGAQARFVSRKSAARRALWLLALFASLVLVGAGNAQVPPESSGPPPSSKEPDVDRLLDRFDQLYESSGTAGEIEISIIKPGKTRTLRMRMWSKGEDKALIVVDAPARDAGMATLRVGQNLWNYLPKISRTIRVPPSLMMGSWMGSDLTNDDIVRETSYRDDYTSALIGRSADPPGWKVGLDARPDAVGLWNRVEIVFSYDHELPVQSQFFDRKGRLSRTMRFEEIQRTGGRLVPMMTTIIPENEDGQRTELRYLNLEFDVELDESVFSLSRLEGNR